MATVSRLNEDVRRMKQDVCDELKNLIAGKNRRPVYTSTAIRRHCLLTKEDTLTHAGLIYDIRFDNAGGGVWTATAEGGRFV